MVRFFVIIMHRFNPALAGNGPLGWFFGLGATSSSFIYKKKDVVIHSSL